MQTYLIHHGILGQKWGIRRYQNPDGTLKGPKAREHMESFSNDKPKKKKHHEKLVDKYKEKGMSNEEAEEAANKRQKIEKTVAITAGAMTLAAAYAGYKYYKYSVDKTLSKDTNFKRVMALDVNEDLNFTDGLYVSYKKADNFIYEGAYAGGRLGGAMEGNKKTKYQYNIKFDNDVKIASPKNAKNTFKELQKDNPELYKKYKNYRQFNRYLAVDKKEEGTKLFYDTLKKKGYGGIRDENDFKSGAAKDPLILFNNSNAIYTRKQLNDKDIQNKANIGMVYLLGKNTIKDPTVMSTVAVGVASKISKEKKKKEAIDKYKKDHPGTNKTNSEIAKTLKLK